MSCFNILAFFGSTVCNFALVSISWVRLTGFTSTGNLFTEQTNHLDNAVELYARIQHHGRLWRDLTHQIKQNFSLDWNANLFSENLYTNQRHWIQDKSSSLNLKEKWWESTRESATPNKDKSVRTETFVETQRISMQIKARETHKRFLLLAFYLYLPIAKIPHEFLRGWIPFRVS